MSQELNLRDPRSNPEVGIVIIWGFEVSDTPDNFDSKLFEAVEKCVDAPLLPFANWANRNINNWLIFTLGLIHKSKKLRIFLAKSSEEVTLRATERTGHDIIWGHLDCGLKAEEAVEEDDSGVKRVPIVVLGFILVPTKSPE